MIPDRCQLWGGEAVVDRVGLCLMSEECNTQGSSYSSSVNFSTSRHPPPGGEKKVRGT